MRLPISIYPNNIPQPTHTCIHTKHPTLDTSGGQSRALQGMRPCHREWIFFTHSDTDPYAYVITPGGPASVKPQALSWGRWIGKSGSSIWCWWKHLLLRGFRTVLRLRWSGRRGSFLFAARKKSGRRCWHSCSWRCWRSAKSDGSTGPKPHRSVVLAKPIWILEIMYINH